MKKSDTQLSSPIHKHIQPPSNDSPNGHCQSTPFETTDSFNNDGTPSVITIGIDWADRQHAFAATLPNGAIETGSFEHQPQTINNWIAGFQVRFPDARLHIAIETSRGALINALLEYPAVTLFPINPHAMACYRKAFAHGGGKSDPVDARLIMQYLAIHQPQLRPLQLNQPLTRQLAELAKDRCSLVEQRVAYANRLKDLLKRYFPTMLELSAAKPYAHFIIAVLLRYPTLAEVQHPDYAIFKSFPGAAVKTQARLIAALGDDRNRFDSAQSLQCAAGIAPLTEQSGKARTVHRRWAATTFMMQTFFEYAGLSISHCTWAKTFYESQLAKGKSASIAKRALAYKWIRIIYHCWKISTPYREQAHLENLAAQGSPLVKKIAA